MKHATVVNEHMNDRIKELAALATTEVWGNNQYNGAPEFEGYELDQKIFVNSMIQECAHVIIQAHRGHINPALVIDSLNNYFGVE